MDLFQQYADHEFKPLEFLKFAKTHSAYFTNYLEVIVDRRGHIHLAVPSHSEKLIQLAVNQFGFNDDIASTYLLTSYIVSKYGYISIWYDIAVLAGDIDRGFCGNDIELEERLKRTVQHVTVHQMRTLKILLNSGLLSNKYKTSYERDYQCYLRDTAMFTNPLN